MPLVYLGEWALKGMEYKCHGNRVQGELKHLSSYGLKCKEKACLRKPHTVQTRFFSQSNEEGHKLNMDLRVEGKKP